MQSTGKSFLLCQLDYRPQNFLPIVCSSAATLLSLGVGWFLWAQPVSARPVPDNTLAEESSVVTPVSDIRDLIEGGAVRGNNRFLFHSFETFDINEGNEAYFANPTGVLTILGRVTGNDGSDIFGTLGVDGPASLFLLNPNGIVFGPDSQLDIAGSFTASTAERLVFSDGSIFRTVNPNAAPLLQVNVTPGLQYGGNTSATITNQGNLAVGQNLTLGAPLLSLSGSLTAGQDITVQGARRQLSDADYTVGGYLFTQTLDGTGVEMVIPHAQVIEADGDVQLTADYEGPSLHILAGGQVTQSPDVETITVTGGTGGSVTKTLSDGDGGTQSITVSATEQPTIDIRSGVDWLSLTGAIPENTNTSGLAVNFGEVTGQIIVLDTVTSQGIGETGELIVNLKSQGDINLNSIITSGGSITLESQGNIVTQDLDSSRTLTPFENSRDNNGGRIFIQASENISVGDITSFSLSEIGADVDFERNGGDIAFWAGRNISAGALTSGSLSFLLSDSGELVGGNGGAISLSAGNNIITKGITSLSGSDSFTGDVFGGDGGTIDLSAGNNITIEDGEIVSFSGATSFAGNVRGGNGGNITFSAQNNIDSGSLNSNSLSRTDSFAGNVSGGNGGNIILEASNINVESLNSDSESFSDIEINQSLRSGDLIGGNGGNVSLIADGNLNTEVIDSTSSSTSLSGDVTGGNGGDITLRAGDIDTTTLASSSDADALSVIGNVTGGGGGNILLESTTGNIRAENLNSVSVSTSSLFSSVGNIIGGNGGTIVLDGEGRVSIEGNLNSFSLSESFSGSITGGDGGDIKITAGDFFINGNLSSFVFLQSAKNSSTLLGGNGGDVTLATLDFRAIEDSSILTFSVAEGGAAGNGGNVSIAFENFDATLSVSDIEVLTLSSSALSGEVTIETLGDLVISNSNVISSKQVEIDNPVGSEPIIISVGGQGQSGPINVFGKNILIKDSSFISDTNGSDSAGIISIDSSGWIIFENSFINSSTSSTGQAGSINARAVSGVRLTGENSQLLAQTSNQGIAGNILVDAPQVVVEDDAQISTSTIGQGFAGNIKIEAETVTLRNGGQIIASTAGSGSGGTIDIDAENSILLGEGVQNSIPIISVEASNAGNPGDIDINTPNFVLSETARITATSLESATNLGGGSITISADQMDLAGTVGIFAETQGQSPGGTLILQPYDNPSLNTTNPNLNATFAPGATISASTSSSGPGGNLQVRAPESIKMRGPGLLAVETSGSGRAGTITFRTNDLVLRNGLTVSAATSDGPGGNIFIEGFDRGPINNRVRINNSTITSEVLAGENATITGGDIRISGGDIRIVNGSSLRASTNAVGEAGNVIIENADNVVFNSSLAASESRQGATGSGQNVDIQAQNLQLLNESQLTASTRSSGNAGKVNIEVDDIVLFDNSSASTAVRNDASGVGGDVRIFASQIELLNGAQVNASTRGVGEAGDIVIRTRQLDVGDNSSITGSTRANGEAGRIRVNQNQPAADIIHLSNGRIETRASEAGNAGGINLNTQELLMDNRAQISASTQSSEGGNIELRGMATAQLDDSTISAETETGKAGRLNLIASELINLNHSRLSAQANRNSGSAGDLSIATSQLILTDNSEILASNRASQTGGNITLRNLEDLTVRNSEISAETRQGTAGNLNIFASDTVQLDNSSLSVQATGSANSDESANAQSSSRGVRTSDVAVPTAGGLVLRANELFIENESDITVSSPNGRAGNIDIDASRVFLNTGAISAETGSNTSEGETSANVNLDEIELLFLEDNSFIEAQANSGANGGNITLEAADGFIIAETLNNNDIIASAEGEGDGGNINISALRLFGLEECPGQFDELRANNTNDISASSEFGTAGVIAIDDLGVDPVQAATELPVETNTVPLSRGCEPGSGRGNFTNTEQGGIPPSPDDPIASDDAWEDIHPPEASVDATSITEAETWHINEDGQIVLQDNSAASSIQVACQ